MRVAFDCHRRVALDLAPDLKRRDQSARAVVVLLPRLGEAFLLE